MKSPTQTTPMSREIDGGLINIVSFIVKGASEFPPPSDWFQGDGQTSAPHFARCRTTSGKVALSVVVYDFRFNKWRFLSAGCAEVMEWYERMDDSIIDAHLIAAAPKMLEALILCHDYMHDLIAEPENQSVARFKDKGLEQAYITLRTAIISATNDPTAISSAVCL